MVSYVKQRCIIIEQHLIRLLFREDCFAELLAEPGDMARKRSRAHETHTLLQVRSCTTSPYHVLARFRPC